MKKYLSLISFLILSFVGFTQTQQNLGAPNTNVVVRGLMGIDTGFQYRTSYADTTAANLSQYLSSRAGMTIRTGNTLWIRNSDATRWLEFGSGSLNVDTTQTVLLSGAGSVDDPLVAHVQISQQQGNALDTLPDGIYVPSMIQNGIISGLRVIWETGLTYTVTAGTYAINGIVYNSPETSITLDNADPSLNRFDGFVATTSSTVVDLTGTPSADPQNPSYNAATQIPITFVLVTAASTEPTYCRDSLYFPNNGQTWTSVSGTGRIVVNSTNNPYSVTEDIEFTLARNNDQLRITKATVVSLGTYSVLVLKIRSKATWATTSRLALRWYNGLTPLGIEVVIGDGIFSFNSSITNEYQTVVIPLTNFGSVTNPDNLLFTVRTNGSNTIGLYADNIELLGCDGAPIPETGNFWQVGGNRQGVTLVGGTLDNFPVQLKANNTNHTLFQTGGSMLLQGSTPRISFLTNTGAASDYYIWRSGTTLIHNSAGDYTLKVANNTMYLMGAANGHIWSSSAAAFQMQLNTTGNLLLGTNANNATTILNVSSTTKASHPFPTMTTAQKNAIVAPQEGDLVYDDDLDTYYYYDGAWLPIGTVTASNGLTATANNVVLGGTALSGNTSIPTSAFSLTVNSSNATSALIIDNSSSGNGIVSTSVSGQAVYGESTNGNGGEFSSTNQDGLTASSATTYGFTAQSSGSLAAGRFYKASAATNTVLPLIEIDREVAGTAANGVGSSIDFYTRTTVLFPISNQIISKWSNATSATRTSEFSITGVNSATTGTILTIAGDGSITVGAAYQGLGAGYLAVSNTGVVSWSAATGSMTNPMTTAGDIIYSSDGAGTPARLGIGTSGQVLTVSAGGIPEWTSAVGTGTVTSVGWTGGIVSIATATTTPAFTIAGTSGGIPYFSSTSTWASSAALAANAIVIGGGAGVAPATTTTGTGVLTALGINVGSAGAFVTFNGAGGTPSSINLTNGTVLPLTTGVTGVLDETNGGTGQSTLTQGDILFASAANTFSKLAIGTANQVLRVNAGATALEWATLAGSGTVTSVTLTQPAAGITITNSGVAITGSGTRTFALANDLAAVEALATTGIVRRTGTDTWTAGTLVSLTTEITGTLQEGNGGTGETSYTNGQLLIGNGTGLTKATLTGTSNQINITNGAGSITISMAFNPTVQALTDAATITWNVTNGGNAQVTLGSTGRTLSITNPVAGYTYTIEITQGSGGSKTITTWPTGTRWTGGTTPTLSTTAGQRDVVSLYYNGSNYYGTFLPNMN